MAYSQEEMSVLPSEMATHLVRRVEADQKALAGRQEHAWKSARAIAHRLRADFGATDVYLFGSLASGYFHARSDIDLAVRGVPAERLAQAWIALESMAAPLSIDMLDFDSLPTGWRETVSKKGVRLP